jgi:5-methylcytosine-specific restriction endonuclease McrA
MCRLDGCGAIFVPVHVNQKCCCEQHGKRFWKQTHPRKPDPMTEKRRANLRRKTQQRRARLKGDATAELIDRDQIGERDGWCCGLCSQPVDKSLAYPHPQSASLDHVKPLSLGGKHVEANVQISHLTCNVAKGNRVADVQPLLVG